MVFTSLRSQILIFYCVCRKFVHFFHILMDQKHSKQSICIFCVRPSRTICSRTLFLERAETQKNQMFFIHRMHPLTLIFRCKQTIVSLWLQCVIRVHARFSEVNFPTFLDYFLTFFLRFSSHWVKIFFFAKTGWC